LHDTRTFLPYILSCEGLKSLKEFQSNFQVTEKFLTEFVHYAEKEFGIPTNLKGLNTSKGIIKQNIKAEIARQLWTEQGYYSVISSYDNEILKALNYLKK